MRGPKTSKARKATTQPKIIHHGVIAFDSDHGEYRRSSGSESWKIRRIDWPGLPGPPSVGQVLIEFAKPIKGSYTPLVAACRTSDAPMIAANCGDLSENGFVVVLFNPIGKALEQTVRDGDFSFVVVQ